MRRVPCGLFWRASYLGVLVFLASRTGTFGPRAVAADDPPQVRENRDTRPAIDIVDSVRVPNAYKAVELEGEVKKAYAKLAPSVVRIWQHNDQGVAFDEKGIPVAGGYSGVIIEQKGLILTCSHHRLAPETSVTIELADGKRVAGEALGRFKLEDPQPMHFGPDLGLARITEPGDWPAATIEDGERTVNGQTCLAIGYPGTLPPGRPPLLRVGRILPRFPGIPWLETTTAIGGGDSGGPLFDLAGRVVGIARGGDSVEPTSYQSVARLKEFREPLESGKTVSAADKMIRARRARPAHPAAFIPAPDLEDQVLRVQRSVIRIMDGPHEIAAGLIVDADGWAITKASLVGSRQQWSCRLFYVVDGKAIVKGRVVATSAEHDLALMKLDVRDWQIAPWSAARPIVGTFVCSPLGSSAGALQFAVKGAVECAELAKPNDIPQIMVNVEPDEAGVPIVKQTGGNNAEFDAYQELFRPGDVVSHLNGIRTPTHKEFGRVMDRLTYATRAESGDVDYNVAAPGSFAGDWVSIGIRRGTEEHTIRVPRVHSGGMGALEWHQNPRSLRRESLPMVFAHDGFLRPEQCGGPVVDLAGNVVGLNIARADTTRSLAIPADVLEKVIAELRRQAESTAK